MKKHLFFTLMLLPGFIFSSCGPNDNGNAFASLVPKNQKQQAQDDLQQGNYNGAINALTAYLKNHPGDSTALSMLASAYLMQAGVNVLSLAAGISSGLSNNLTDLQSALSALPTATQSNITSLTNAVTALQSIPSSEMSAEQSYQLGIVQAVLAVTIVKSQVVDSAGNISSSMVSSLSDTEANSIYTNLSGAQSAFTTAGVGSSAQASSALANLVTSINSSAGATNADKVRSFLDANT